MKKVLIISGLLLLSSLLTAQISVYGRGSNMTGLLGIEAQIGSISIAESWRPLTRGEHSYITTVNYFFHERVCTGLIPFVSLSYSSKSFAYQTEYSPFYYDAATVEFAPAIGAMVGYKSNITNHLSGRGAAGLIISKHGNKFGFEVGVNIKLF